MIIATTPPRITITADDVRELLRQWPEWKQVPSVLGGGEAWRWHGTDCGAWTLAIPDDPTKADYQIRLWDAVRVAASAMGIGTDIFVHLGMMLQRRQQTYLGGWFEDERRRGHPLPNEE